MAKKVYLVPVYWEMYGRVSVEAESPEKALEYAREHMDEYKLPYKSEYVEGSFDVDMDGTVLDLEGNLY